MPSLCLRGAKKDEPDSEGNVPLWNAIKLELFDIAETLVEQGADVDFWQFDELKNVSFDKLFDIIIPSLLFDNFSFLKIS